MLVINSPSQLDSLELESDIKDSLMAELILPFGTLEQAENFWQETKTNLIALLPTNSGQQDSPLDAEILDKFEHVEFVTHLTENWYLAVVITADDGGGSYLLFQRCIHPQLDQLVTTHIPNGEHYDT